MFTVDVSHLTEEQLLFFGWVIVKETDDFLIYLHIRTGEEQPVSKKGKRLLIVDDVNDAQQMSKAGFYTIPRAMLDPRKE
jgi:hypothetical protein